MVYRAHCIPLKLRLDMIYAEKRGLALDLLILWRTFARLRQRPALRNQSVEAGHSVPDMTIEPLAA